MILVFALRLPEEGWPPSDIPWYGLHGSFATMELAERFAAELRSRGVDTGRPGYADVRLCEVKEIS